MRCASLTVRGAWTAYAKPKFGNRITPADGIRFASKLEANRYRELKLLCAAGEVLYFLRQVPLQVASNVVYRVDFMVIWNRRGAPAECITFEETKGHMTDTARVKIAAVQERYGITITLLRRGDVRR